MSVDSTHPEYDKMLDEWNLVRACSAGQREVKALKTKILPAPDGKTANGTYTYCKDRYKSYIGRAIYTNVTGRTKQGLTGAAFRIPPEIDLPTELEFLNENADGSGQSLEQLSKDVLGSLMESGREILLTDYPAVEAGRTAEQDRKDGITATIKRYACTDLDNWSTSVVNGKTVLSMAKLIEMVDVSDDEFSYDYKKQYRVLRLRDEGYSQQVYQDGEPITEEVFPTKKDGSGFDFIPLFVIGSQNNDPSVDDIPLADIAHVNIGHFRNSADLEESSYIVGQPMIHIDIGEMDAEAWNKLNPNGIAFGSNTSVQTVKGSVDMVQVSENQLPDKLQERKEAQMLALGAKLVEQRNPNETAAAAKIDATGENSVLSDIVGNVEEGIQRSIEWCGMFMGADVVGADVFIMNRQFFDDSVDPQTVIAGIQLYDRTVIAKSDLQNVARKANMLEAGRTNDEIDNETGQASPLV